MLTALGKAIYISWLKWVIAFSPLVIVFLFAARINQMSTSTAQAVFWAFAALMGLSLSSIFVMYTGTSITRIFFITAATFGTVSLWGYTTKRDLTQMGSFLMMGLIGIVIASRRERVPALVGHAIRHLGAGGCDLYRPYRLRHADAQG